MTTPNASLAFLSRDTLGFEVRSDVGIRMRWIALGLADQLGTSISRLPVRLQSPTNPNGSM